MRKIDGKKKGPVPTALPADDMHAVVVPLLDIFEQCLPAHTPLPAARARMRGDVGILCGDAMNLDCYTKIG